MAGSDNFRKFAPTHGNGEDCWAGLCRVGVYQNKLIRVVDPVRSGRRGGSVNQESVLVQVATVD